MATYVVLVNFTEQGIKNAKDSPARFDAFRTMAKGLGVEVKSVYWTMGTYDIVLTLEGSEDAVGAAVLKVASLGNVRPVTMRAFGEEEVKKVAARAS